MVTTNGVNKTGRTRPLASSSRFRVGALHLGEVKGYYFGKHRRLADSLPEGVFIDFGGPRPGIIFDHGRLGLRTGESVSVKIINLPGRGAQKNFELEFVEKMADSERGADATDIGPFMIVPRTMLPSPLEGPQVELDALVPRLLAIFSVNDRFPEEARQLVEKGITVTCPINDKQYRFLAPEAVWQVAQDLASGKRISVTIGKYVLGVKNANQALLPVIPGYAPALIEKPSYILGNEGETWEVYLRDPRQSNFEDVARQIGEGKLRLAIVPKPMKGQVFKPERSFAHRNLMVSIPRPDNIFWTYSLAEYFDQTYKVGDEIEIILIGERGEHPYHETICAPVRELKQLEKTIEALRQEVEAEIMKTGFQGDYSSKVQIKIGTLALPAQIIFGDKPVQTFTVGQKVRLSLAAEISERLFQGNELFWVSQLSEHGMNHIKLTIVD